MRQLGVILIGLLALCSCEKQDCKHVKHPEDIGRQVVDILYDLDDKSYDDFEGCFASMDDIVDLGFDPDVDKKELEAEREDDLRDNMYDLLDDGIDHDIDWETLRFVDFEFEVESTDGINGKEFEIVDGRTYFRCNSGNFKIKSSSVLANGYYLLGQVRSIREDN